MFLTHCNSHIQQVLRCGNTSKVLASGNKEVIVTQLFESKIYLGGNAWRCDVTSGFGSVFITNKLLDKFQDTVSLLSL
jgi:hypothetical protein